MKIARAILIAALIAIVPLAARAELLRASDNVAVIGEDAGGGMMLVQHVLKLSPAP